MSLFHAAENAVVMVFCVLFIGCASTPKIDWDARVGTFTYDQAVKELGLPLVSTKLTEGSTVADWPEHPGGGGRVSFGVGASGYAGGVGAGMSQSVGPATREAYLRLTFDKNGTLTAWTRNYR